MSTARPNTQQPHELEIISHAAAQTRRLGERLGALLRPGDLLLLHGDLGAGKTLLVSGIVAGLGSTDQVTSPTFVLLNEYRAAPIRTPIIHADLYRIADPAELAGIGLEDTLSEAVTLVEWPERAAGQLPAEHLAITLRHLAETKRVIRFSPHGPRYLELLDTLRPSVFA